MWITRTPFEVRRLRRYASGKCPSGWGFHDATVPIGTGLSKLRRELTGSSIEKGPALTDPRWPVKCSACRYRFKSTDPRQLWRERLYLYRGIYGNWLVVPGRNTPPGALWDSTAWSKRWGHIGPDGIGITVTCPGGTSWEIDGQASNCTRKTDHVHRCWVRSGKPNDPQGKRWGKPLDVGKNGNTCAAGAGSIAVPGYHGFLHDGFFTAG